MAFVKILVRSVIMTLIGAGILALYQINNGLFDPLRYTVSVIILALVCLALNGVEHYWKSHRAAQKTGRMRWQAIHVGLEKDGFLIQGLDVWNEDWRKVDTPSLKLPHPEHTQQRHTYQVYEIGPAERPVRFAAGELSNGVWGFYIPTV